MQRLDLRRQPGLRLALGPQQLVAELGELRRAALLAAHQRMAQRLLPALEFAPDVAVRQAECPRRGRDRAVLAHRVQQFHERIADQRAAVAARCDDVGEFDLLHETKEGEARCREGLCRGRCHLCIGLHKLGLHAWPILRRLFQHSAANEHLHRQRVAAWHLVVSGRSRASGPSSAARWPSAAPPACWPAASACCWGAWLAVARFAGPRRCCSRCSTPCSALPSVVVGLVIYLLLSRSGPLGSWGILFTPQGDGAGADAPGAAGGHRAVAPARRRRLREGGEQLRSLGAGPLPARCCCCGTSAGALVTVLIAAFGRAVSEVGAVMIVGGNIDGVTRVMTTAIALETSKGDLPLALALGPGAAAAWCCCSTLAISRGAQLARARRRRCGRRGATRRIEVAS